MSQFDLYVNTDADTNSHYPFFVDIQNGLLDVLNSRVVIPLTPVTKQSKKYPDNLCPVIRIHNKNYALLTHQITSVPVSLLKQKEKSLINERDVIISALDFLVMGI